MLLEKVQVRFLVIEQFSQKEVVNIVNLRRIFSFKQIEILCETKRTYLSVHVNVNFYFIY